MAFLGALGFLLGGVGLIFSFMAAQQQAAMTKKIGQYNAQQAQNQAKQERLDRAAEETQERKEARRRIAAIENSYAASGVLVDGTSALNALAEQTAADEMNILNRTRVSENKAKQIESSGKIGLWEANMRAKAIKTQAIGDLVGGFGSLMGASSGGGGGRVADTGGSSGGGGPFSNMFG